eukprot:scaffold55513_cov69-Phaeocystis_antarctica.AAC.2
MTRFFRGKTKIPVDLPTGLTRCSGPNGGVLTSGRYIHPPAQRGKMGYSERQRPFPMIKTMCAKCTDPAPSISVCGPKRNQDTMQDGRRP